MPRIRQAVEGDIAEIVAVVNAAFQVESEFRAGDRTSLADISRLMQSSMFLVAAEDESVVGAVLVRITGATGYFGMLAVRPGLQRSGIGRALLEAAEDYCRAHGCVEMTLSTGRVRQELLRYYGKMGYAVTSIETAPEGAPFTRPIEIVRMAKALQDGEPHGQS
jgi:GNAT superfamily N-acetyltransferase